MTKTSRIMLIAFVLLSTGLTALADRGIGKKSKTSKVTLNISTPSTLKNSLSINFNSGLRYTGSMFSYQKYSLSKTSLITYQKGNVTYIIPYKHKVITPDLKPGYSGVKFVIKPR
jgi:hypothetical protein